MREIAKRVFVNALSLFLISQVLVGLDVTGGFVSYLYAGLILAVLTILLDPVVKMVTLPFHILTLGLISFFTTTVALFILTLIYKSVTITSFTFAGVEALGIRASEIHFSGILSYVVISATIYFLNKLIVWLFAD